VKKASLTENGKKSNDIRDYGWFSQLRRQVKKDVRKSKRQYIERIFADASSPKEFWSAFKKFSPEDRSIPALIDDFGSTYCSSAEKASILQSAFLRNFSQTDNYRYSPPDLDNGDYFDCEVSISFIHRQLATLKLRGAPGIDCLTPSILRNIASSIAPAFTALCNRSLLECQFPTAWKIAKVVPVPKPGDRHLAKNYRPISLLPVLSKILEQHVQFLLRSRLCLSSNQHGFRPRYSTTTALIRLTQSIHDGLNHKESRVVGGIFFDLKRAFDRVSHNRLMEVLEKHHRLSPRLLAWVQSYLQGRTQFTSVGATASQTVPVTSGVPQGSVLAPILFVAFIDPILTKFSTTFPFNQTGLLLQAYADDLVLISPGCSVGEVDQWLQPAVDYISEEIANLRLEFNVEKTQGCIFRYHNKKINHPKVHLNDTQITFTESVRYLGVTLSAQMDFSDHCQQTASSARQMIGAFKRKFGKFAPGVFKTTYTQCILPRLEYGCCAWSPVPRYLIDDLERAQKFAGRSILNNWDLPYESAMEALGWKPLEIRRQHLKLFQFYKFYHGLAAYPTAARFHHKVDSDRRFSARTTSPHHIVVPDLWKSKFGQSFEYSVTTHFWNRAINIMPYEVAIGPFNAFKVHVTNTNF
jgi:retron-type reverse transcriptase